MPKRKAPQSPTPRRRKAKRQPRSIARKRRAEDTPDLTGVLDIERLRQAIAHVTVTGDSIEVTTDGDPSGINVLRDAELCTTEYLPDGRLRISRKPWDFPDQYYEVEDDCLNHDDEIPDEVWYASQDGDLSDPISEESICAILGLKLRTLRVYHDMYRLRGFVAENGRHSYCVAHVAEYIERIADVGKYTAAQLRLNEYRFKGKYR